MTFDIDQIVRRNDQNLRDYGLTPAGAGWFSQEHVAARYRVMAGVMDGRREPGPVRLLDVGCGPGMFLSHLGDAGLVSPPNLYTGIDLNREMVEAARLTRYGRSSCVHLQVHDLLTDDVQTHDFGFLCGVFTEKCGNSGDDMWRYARTLMRRVFDSVHVGFAANFTTIHLPEFEGELFHLPIDELVDFLIRDLDADVVVRHDYKPTEYTAYVYH